MLGLADRHGPERLDLACRKALDYGDASYRTVKGILAAGLEATATPEPAGQADAPAFLHGPARLFDPDTGNPDETVISACDRTEPDEARPPGRRGAPATAARCPPRRVRRGQTAA